jgi:hypothetical protein
MGKCHLRLTESKSIKILLMRHQLDDNQRGDSDSPGIAQVQSARNGKADVVA